MVRRMSHWSSADFTWVATEFDAIFTVSPLNLKIARTRLPVPRRFSGCAGLATAWFDQINLLWPLSNDAAPCAASPPKVAIAYLKNKRTR
jgi:hypothetical protein